MVADQPSRPATRITLTPRLRRPVGWRERVLEPVAANSPREVPVGAVKRSSTDTAALRQTVEAVAYGELRYPSTSSP